MTLTKPLLVAALSALSLEASAATSFGFEDITVPAHTVGYIPAGYAGATFEGFILRRTIELQYTGLNSNDVSDILAVAVEAMPTISFAAPTAFDGAFLINPGGTISYELFLGGALKATSAAIGVNASFSSSGYAGAIDKIVFHQASGHNFSLDDVMLSPAAAVPEPQTYALLLTGLLMLGRVAHRRTARRR